MTLSDALLLYNSVCILLLQDHTYSISPNYTKKIQLETYSNFSSLATIPFGLLDTQNIYLLPCVVFVSFLPCHRTNIKGAYS